MAHPGRPNLPAVTGLRFFLALLVVVFHSSGADGTLRSQSVHVPAFLSGIVASGYAMVGFFFLLSGFVLAYGFSLTEAWTTKQWKRFLVARIARIYPVYVLALVFSLPIALVVMLKDPGHSTGQNIATLISTPLLLQSWLPGSTSVWNGPGWSLSVEAFFYLLFPVVGVLLWRIHNTRTAVFGFVCVWGIGMIAISEVSLHLAPDLWIDNAMMEPLRDSWNSVVKFNPLIHLPAFLAGILAAKVYLGLAERPSLLRPGRGAWLYLPSIALEIFSTTHAGSIPYPLMHDGLLIPAHATLLVGIALGGGGLPELLSGRVMVLLGQSSYALYLLHVPINWYWVAVGKHILHRPMVGIGWSCAYLSSCIATSCAVFYFVEEPMRRRILTQYSVRQRSEQPTTR